MSSINIYIDSGISNNYLVTIAIGKSYLKNWEDYALPFWSIYCKKNSLGLLVVVQDLIDDKNSYWKKATWQKLLIGKQIIKQGINANNICYLDTDILINPFAPNIFEFYDSKKIGMVSNRINLPYPYIDVRRRIAFFRNKYYDSNYPLDSALFIPLDKLYEFHGLKPQSNEACAGLILFNLVEHSKIMSDIFFKYDFSINSITDGGDQTHVNFEFQNLNLVQWLDYKFQALWFYEMAWKYPFLYKKLENDINLLASCIESSLLSNCFLHFAGSWHESNMWKEKTLIKKIFDNGNLSEFNEYMKKPVFGKPQGIRKPNKI